MRATYGLRYNSVLLAITSVASQVFLLISFWYYARHVTTSELGIAMAALGLAVFALGTLDFGVSAAAVRHLAINRLDLVYRDNVFSAKILIAGLVAVIWATASAILALYHSDFLYVIVFAPYILLEDIVVSLNVQTRSQENMRPLAATTLVDKFVSLLVIIVLIRSSVPSAWSLPIAFLMGALSAAWLACRMNQIPRPSLFDAYSFIPKLWSDSRTFGVSALALQAQRLDTTIVASLAGPA